jgi:heat shock protein HslJ
MALLSLLVVASMLISACVVPTPAPAPEPAPQDAEVAPVPPAEGETLTLFVGPNQAPCMGVAPQSCLLVKEDPAGDYQLFYSRIDGFEFEPGFEYELLVNRQTVPNPPADASSFRWTLIEVVNKTPVGPTAELEGTIWQLIAQTDENGMLTMPRAEANITLQEGEANGQGGCNMFFAPYTLDGSLLSFGPAGSTMMACEEPAMRQEQAFLANLEKIASYQIVANQLQMADADGAVLLAFQPQVQTPLTGTLWQVVSVNNGQEAVTGVISGTQLTATFQEDGTVFGSAGCNNFSGGYTVQGDQIQIGPLAMTMMFCPEPEGVIDQEMAFGAALESAATFSIQGDSLELRTADGALAVSFAAASPATAEPAEPAEAEFALEGPIWQLTSFLDASGAQAAAAVEATIRLEEGRASGNASCNRFFTAYVLEGSQLSFDQAGSTMMACPEPMMSQEQAFLTNLGLVASYEIAGAQLTLLDADGVAVLTFEVQVPLPLAGTLWQATGYNNGRGGVTSLVIGTEITATFNEDGTLSGSAGCNNYTATYAADDQQITITPVATTMMLCPEPEGIMEQEAEFIAALGTAATYTIEGDQLALRTADGALVASFVAAAREAAGGVDAETMDMLGNLAYSNTALFTETVQLVNGAYTTTVAPGAATVVYVELTDVVAAGEINGQPAYAAVLASNGGGSGVFYDLAVVAEVDGAWTNVATTGLGDRVAINSLTIENNQVVVDMITQGPDDPMCCPTQQVVVAYELQDGQLVEVEPASADARSADAGIVGATWEWVESVYGDDTTIATPVPSSYTLTLQPDGSVALVVDCNLGGGTYTLDGSALSLDVAVMTRVACPEGTLSNEFIRDLNAAATFVMDGENLVINLFADAGNMVFQPGPAAAAAAGPAAMAADTLTLSVEGVADSYETQVVPATPYDASMPPGPVGAPEHLAVTFDGQSLDEASFAGRVIYLAPVDAYETLWLDAGNDTISNTVGALTTLLAEQPVDPPPPLPVLPPAPAVNDVAVQVAYFDVPGLDAAGMRWVGRFSQDLSPVMNFQLRYIFQGLSADGQTLISTSFPITTALLPDSMETMTEDESAAFDADPVGFLEATASALSFLSPSDFSPSLDALDAMMQSLAISTTEVTVSGPVTPTATAPLTATGALTTTAPVAPTTPAAPAVSFADLAGQDWQWVAFTDPVNGTQAIANPAKYVVHFLPSGTVRVTADCNRGAGRYTVDGASLDITVQAMTRAMCPPSSQSTQFVQNLDAAAIWFVQDGDLFFDLFADSGTMRFAPAK